MDRKPTFLETLAIEHDKSIARQLAEERRRRLLDAQIKGATIEETMGNVWDAAQSQIGTAFPRANDRIRRGIEAIAETSRPWEMYPIDTRPLPPDALRNARSVPSVRDQVPSTDAAPPRRSGPRFNPHANDLPVWLPDVEVPAGIMPRRGEPLPPSEMERAKAEHLSKMILGLPLRISGGKTPQTLDPLGAFALRRMPNA